MQTLSIGIDGYNLALRSGTGVARYGFTLAETLLEAGHHVEGVFGIDTGQDPSLREVMFFDMLSREPDGARPRKQIRKDERRLMKDAIRPWRRLDAVEVPLTDDVERGAFKETLPPFDRLSSAPYLFEIAFRHFALYGRFLRVRAKNPPQIMHWTYPVPLEMEGCRNVYTLHDLVPLRLPYTTLDSKHAYSAIVRQCVQRASHICTVSEASRRDIISLLGAAPDRVTNTYQASAFASDTLALSAGEDARMIEGILGFAPKEYFLFFGAIEPKKNVGRLIEAYLSIQTRSPLVIVGAGGWQSEGETRLLSNSQSVGVQRVIRLDRLPRPLLLRLIRSARAVVFPSLYEGFGLPVLEAMQLGTPVLTSITSSLPEVAGDGAILVDPYDVVAIANGLKALDGDAALRKQLADAGLKQSERFSKAEYLARLERMYERIIA